MQATLSPSQISAQLAPLGARERIGSAFDFFGKDLILATSFGTTAGVMLRLATQVYPGIRVITVRHGYESRRTLQLADYYRTHLNLNLKVYEAPRLPIPDEGTPAFEAFKQSVKVEPFRKALAIEQPAAWLSGVMREETETRKSFDFAMPKNGALAVYPILDWSPTDAEEFCLAHGLPLNNDYYDPAKGLSQKSECGLHLGDIGSSWTCSGL
jgi:phosphoadenosine phosphosulfate reductase